MAFLTFLALTGAAVMAWVVYGKLRQSRRNRLYKQPLPGEWLPVLQSNVLHYPHLPEDLKARLHGLIHIFLADKVFIACAGINLTDEMRLTIAGNACLLLLNQDRDYYPGFTSILVYPETYRAREVSYDGLVENQHYSTRAGESWRRGPVVLSWSDVVRGIRNQGDGYNVVLHEFAHKLDEENAGMDGLPVLRNSSDYREWAEILGHEYASLSKRVGHGANTVLDEYGTVSPAEFFAVATESFFEKSAKMKQKLPKLYQQLSRYYGLDPAGWH